jgi:hypothetical protein
MILEASSASLLLKDLQKMEMRASQGRNISPILKTVPIA